MRSEINDMSIPSGITKIREACCIMKVVKVLFPGAPELSWMVWVMKNTRPVNENKVA